MAEEVKDQEMESSTLTMIVIAQCATNGQYFVITKNGNVPLVNILHRAVELRGQIISLGQSFNPSPGMNCMETTVFLVVPKDPEMLKLFE